MQTNTVKMEGAENRLKGPREHHDIISLPSILKGFFFLGKKKVFLFMTHEIVSHEICLWYAHERKPIKHGCPGPPKMMFGSWQFAFRTEFLQRLRAVSISMTPDSP